MSRLALPCQGLTHSHFFSTEGWPASAPQALPLGAWSLSTGRREGAQYKKQYLTGKQRPLGRGASLS